MALKPYSGPVVGAAAEPSVPQRSLVPYSGDIVLDDPSVVRGFGLAGKAAMQQGAFLGEQVAAKPVEAAAGSLDAGPALARAFSPAGMGLRIADAVRDKGLSLDALHQVQDRTVEAMRSTPVSDAVRRAAPGAYGLTIAPAQRAADETRAGLAETNRQIAENRPASPIGGLAYDAGTAAVQMAPGVGLALLTRNPSIGAAAIAAPAAGQYAAEGVDKGLSVAGAFKRAAPLAASEFVLSRPVEALLALPAGKLMQSGALPEAIKRLAKTAAGRGVAGMASEGVEEAATQAVQEAYDSGVLGENTSLSNALQRIGYAGLVGTVAAAPFAAARAGADRVQQRRVDKADTAAFDDAAKQFRVVQDAGEDLYVTPNGTALGTAEEARNAWRRATLEERAAWMEAPQQPAPAAIERKLEPSADPAADLERQRRVAAAQEEADKLYAERDAEAQRRELAFASQGLQVDEQPAESVTMADRRQAPVGPAKPQADEVSTAGIEVGEPEVGAAQLARPPAEDSPKLQSLRALQSRTENGTVRAAIGEEIAVEEKRVRQEAARKAKLDSDSAAAAELRRLAAETDDTGARAALIARADKLTPATSTNGIEVGELKAEPDRTKDWATFKPNDGSLNIPRADMPQIKADHRGAMVNFLGARGVPHEQIEIDPRELKPTQAEYSPMKVEQAKGYTGTDRSILVSSDNRIIDGHHQWLAKMDGGEPVKAIRLDAPASELLPMLREFPSTRYSAASKTPASTSSADTPKPAALGSDDVSIPVEPGPGGAPAPQPSTEEADARQAAAEDGPPHERTMEAAAPAVESARSSAKIEESGEKIGGAVNMGPRDDSGNAGVALSSKMQARVDHSPARVARAGDIRSALIKRFGADVTNLERAGILNIVQSFTDLPADVRRTLNEEYASTGPDAIVRAVYMRDTGKAYMLADLVDAEQAPAMLLHEVGEHYGLQRMLGDKAYARLLNDVRHFSRFSGATREAWATVKENYPSLEEGSDRFVREVIAHVGETAAAQMPWYRRMIQAVRLFLISRGWGRLNLSDDDLRGLVSSSLRRAMRVAEAHGSSERGVEASRSRTTAQAYNARIDALFSGEPARYKGVKVLDRADILDLLGYGDKPLYLVESAVNKKRAGGVAAHPAMTAEQWKKVPAWIESPVAVFDSDTVGGRLTLIAPETVDGKPVVIVLEPNGKSGGIDAHVLVNAYEKDRPGDMPVQRWVKEQKLRYLDQKQSPAFSGRSGLQLPGEVRSLRGYRQKVLTDADLVKYRAEKQANEPGPEPGSSSEGADFSLAGKRQQNPPHQNPPSAFNDETKTDRFVRALADKMNRVLKGQQIAESAGAKINDDTNVYVRENLSYGKANHLGDQLEKNYFDPVLKIMKAAKLTLKQVDDYLYAMHAPERNAVIAARNPAFPDGGSGMTNAEAQRIIASFKGEQRVALARIGELVRKMQDEKLNMMQRYGVLSKADVQQLQSTYKHYVPLKTVEEDGDQFGIGQGFDIRGNEVKMAMGRGSRASSPLMVSFQDYSRAILRSVKNDVGRALYNLASDLAAASVVEIADPADFTIRTTDPKTGQVKTAVDPNYARRDEIFATKVDGETKYIHVKDPLMLQQLKKLGDQQVPEFLNGWREATSLFGRLVTQYNPAFGPVNALRDALQASVLSLSEPGLGGARVLRDIPRAMAGIAGGNKAWAKLYEEFIEDGGATGAYGLKALRDLQSTIESEGIGLGAQQAGAGKQLAALARRGKTRLGRTWGARALESYNEAFENATRLAVYANARKAGKSRQEAAFLSKEISTNFNKKGEWTPVLNAAFAFFNAAVQGNRALLKFAKHPKVAGAIGTLVVAGVLNDLLGAALGGDDDDTGEKNIDEVNDFKRDHAIVLPIDDDHQLMLPLPYGLNVPFLIGRRVSNAIRTGNYGSNMAGILGGIIDNFSPIGSPAPANNAAGSLAKVMTPTLLKPVTDLATNTNFYGGPIYKEASKFDKSPAPRSEDAFRSTTELAKYISRAVNKATGGDKVKPGTINIPPEALDYLMAYYTGGIGRTAQQSVDIGAKLAAGAAGDIDPNRVPLFNRFFGADSRGASSQRYHEIQTDLEYARDYAKQGRSDRITAAQRGVFPDYEIAEKQLAQLRKARKAAFQQGDDATVKRLDDIEQRIQSRVVKHYNSLVKP